MQTVTFELQTNIADKADKYLNSFDSEADKPIDFHTNRMKRDIALMQIDLENYEQKYNMRSDEFYEQFENGELGDDKDFMLWSGIYEMQLNCKQKLQQLK